MNDENREALLKQEIEYRRKNWKTLIGWEDYVQAEEEIEIGERIFSPILHVTVLLGILAMAMILCGGDTVYKVVFENKNRLFYTLYLLAGFLFIYILVIDVWENKKYSKRPPVFLLFLLNWIFIEYNLHILNCIRSVPLGWFSLIPLAACVLGLVLYIKKTRILGRKKAQTICNVYREHKKQYLKSFYELWKELADHHVEDGNINSLKYVMQEGYDEIHRYEPVTLDMMTYMVFGEKKLLIGIGSLAAVFQVGWMCGYYLNVVGLFYFFYVLIISIVMFFAYKSDAKVTYTK